MFGLKYTKTTFEYQISVVCIICINGCFYRLEPYVLQQIKKALRIKSDKQCSHCSESLNSFLNSALNIEFVCLILCSVRSVAYMDSNISKNSVRKSRATKVEMIELENIENWDVEQRNDSIGDMRSASMSTRRSSKGTRSNSFGNPFSRIKYLSSVSFSLDDPRIIQECPNFISEIYRSIRPETPSLVDLTTQTFGRPRFSISFFLRYSCTFDILQI